MEEGVKVIHDVLPHLSKEYIQSFIKKQDANTSIEDLITLLLMNSNNPESSQRMDEQNQTKDETNVSKNEVMEIDDDCEENDKDEIFGMISEAPVMAVCDPDKNELTVFESFPEEKETDNDEELNEEDDASRKQKLKKQEEEDERFARELSLQINPGAEYPNDSGNNNNSKKRKVEELSATELMKILSKKPTPSKSSKTQINKSSNQPQSSLPQKTKPNLKPQPSQAPPESSNQIDLIRQQKNLEFFQKTGKDPADFRNSKSTHIGGDVSSMQQLSQLRRQRHSTYQQSKASKKRIYTLSDLESDPNLSSSTDLDSDSNPTSTSNTPSLSSNKFKAIGQQALKLTNDFRAKNGLTRLEWDDQLMVIGAEHSKNMGDKKVAFGHDGFNGRMKKYRGGMRAGGENVAMSQGYGKVAEVAVKGWIESPGHRKNLLGHWRKCGIGVYVNYDGAYYLTQLFIL